MPVARVIINLGSLNIRVEQDSIYPDMVTDLCNRANSLFVSTIKEAKEAGIDIMESQWVDYGDDDYEED